MQYSLCPSVSQSVCGSGAACARNVRISTVRTIRCLEVMSDRASCPRPALFCVCDTDRNGNQTTHGVDFVRGDLNESDVNPRREDDLTFETSQLVTSMSSYLNKGVIVVFYNKKRS